MTAQKNGLDRSKLKTLEKLKEAGFDTAAKIRTLEMEDVCDHGLESELRNIIDLKKAIKTNHSELAWLMDGTDPRPDMMKEDETDDDRTAGYGKQEGYNY